MSDVAILAILCGFAAAVAWGICDFWAAKATRAVGPATSVIVVNGIGLLAFALFYFLSGHNQNLMRSDMWYAVGGGIAQGIGLISFFQALKVGPVSLVSPLSSAYPLITTILLLMFFHGSLSPRQIIGVAVVTLGVLAASELFNIKNSDRRLGRGPALALLTASAWGLAYVLMSQALHDISWQTASLVQISCIFVTCAVLAPIVKGSEKILTRASLHSLKNPYIIGAGVLQMFGMVIINVGIEQDANLAPVVAAVSACYPVLTILLALKHLKEDFKLVPICGAIVTIAGVIILSLG
ncbi:MAG TPA: EamA family transporter [Verrucomicrobiae bacterium]|nr:EamA family transporter [Verrucomicrobiae bacterium]